MRATVVHRRPPRAAAVLAAGLIGIGMLAAQSTVEAAKPRPRPVARAPSGAASTPTAYLHRQDVAKWMDDIANSHQLDRDWIEQTLGKARYVPAVARLIMPPPAGTAKNWAAYRARFIEARRIQAGVAFWSAHEHWLLAAEQRYGVPAEVVVGIIGVETFFGRMTGGFRVLDALATLAFDFPPGRKDRSAFFKDELGHFLVLTHVEGADPAKVQGSYAGAIGLGQFMPGSIRRFAIDFDGDGHVDMAHNAGDVIGSVAHYLASFGWKPGAATHYPVTAPTDTAARAALLLPDILPSFTAADMEAQGAVLPDGARMHDGPLALIELQNGAAAATHVVGTQNFYALTRYNWSAYYAMAVIELGQAVKAQRALSGAAR